VSLVTHVAVFFAVNPDEELTAADIGAKFGVDPNNVGKTLRYAEEKGWVTITRKPHPTRTKRTIRVYTPGSKLLKEIGR
jgi:DNA-binding MarR family transcriptional regulator